MPTPLDIVAGAVNRIPNTIIGPITIVVTTMGPLRGDNRIITLRFTRTGNAQRARSRRWLHPAALSGGELLAAPRGFVGISRILFYRASGRCQQRPSGLGSSASTISS